MLRTVTLLLGLAVAVPLEAAADRPNIVLIYADDLGFGDVGCNGARAGLTPNVDRLASQGLNFSDAHATSATCTPSRYALLTGEYPWRKQGTGVLPGDARLIVDPGRATLASMLKGAGYRTAVVGKWHLGLGGEALDWNGGIRPGPLELGFDESFIMAATGDRVPCVYVRGHRVVGLDPADPIEVRYGGPIESEPTGRSDPGLLRLHPSHGHDMAIVDRISRIGHMKGGKSALWKDDAMADTFTREAVEFIRRNKSGLFFLYFATHDIHVPRVPHPRFVGKRGMGPRGDAIVEFDWSVGEVLKALDESGLAGKTLVVLTSDNGPVLDDGYRDGAVEELGDHKPAGPYRGGKYSKFEGGTRVPFLVRWPGRVRPGDLEGAGQPGRPRREPRGPGRLPRPRGDGPRQPRPAGGAPRPGPGRPPVPDRARRGARRAPREVEVHPGLERPQEERCDEHRARQRQGTPTLRPRRRSGGGPQRRGRPPRDRGAASQGLDRR